MSETGAYQNLKDLVISAQLNLRLSKDSNRVLNIINVPIG
jgi:hypothetical protein